MKFKSLLLAAGLLVIGAKIVKADEPVTVNPVVAEIRDNLKFTLLNQPSLTPGHFYDFVHGASKGGVTTEIFQYRFFSGDAGWTNALNGQEVGAAVLGGSLHVDRLFAFAWPETAAHILAVWPESLQPLIKRLNYGIFSGYDFDSNGITAGIYTGLSFDLK